MGYLLRIDELFLRVLDGIASINFFFAFLESNIRFLLHFFAFPFSFLFLFWGVSRFAFLVLHFLPFISHFTR